jgi:ribosomal protein L18
VKVDILETDPDSIKNRILRSDDYNDLVSYDPTIHEIRSKLRDAKNREDSKFTGTLIAENLLNADFKRTVPEKINRSANKTKNSRFGSKFIGNNPADKKSKRFKV